MKLRFCLFCHRVGMTVEFPNGNALRKHVRTRHPRTGTEIAKDRHRLNKYRRDVLLAQSKLGVKDTT